MSSSTSTHRRLAALVVAAGLAAALTGCSPTSQPAGQRGDAGAGAAPTPTARTTQTGDAPLLVAEAWAVAKPQLGAMPMTAVFAQITNRDGTPVRIVSASTSASAKAELHHTVGTGAQARMEPTSAFTINPGVAAILRPGGDHIMVMDLEKPLAVGDVIDVTLTTAEGQKVTFTATAKTFTGADESYAPTSSPAMSSPGMSPMSSAPSRS